MKFIAIAATMDWKSKKMDIVHKLLFHGDAIRADAPANPAEMGPGSWSHSLGDDLSHPLLLIRSGVYVPPIFNPGVALVVREEVYQRVSQFSGLRFADARPSKLINCWKPIGDFSFYDSTDPWIRRNRRRPDELLDWMPDDPTLLATFPKCRELVGFNVYGEHEKGTHSVSVNFVMDDDTETEVGFTCSSSVIDRHPLLWGMVFFLRRDLFDLLQDIIDYNHFALKPVDL
jgi:hypothetical protein